MIKDRKNTMVYLIDIGYEGSMNNFYEFYGENTPYSMIEQDSYIDLKSMVYEMVCEKIKFRKHERDGMILTLKAEMTNEEKEKFSYLLNENKFNFFHDYEIKQIREYKKEEDDNGK